VGKTTLVATWQPSLATVGSMAPLETSGALASRRGNGPRLTSPCDSSKRDRGFQEFLGQGGLVRVTDLALKRGRKRVRVALRTNKTGWLNKLHVFPRGVLLKAIEGAVFRKGGTVGVDGRYCVEFED
jgi:hypothetical protein